MIDGPDKLSLLINRTVEKIERLDPAGEDSLLFAGQIQEIREDLFGDPADPGDGETPCESAMILARAMISLVKDIPSIVEAMLNAIDRRTTEPAVRCALAGSLSYLARPRDLLPDDLPGGFGFVDDCMILRATVTEFLKYLPRDFTSPDREKRVLELLAICIPPGRLPEFQAEVEGIWLTFHALLWESEDEVDVITSNILRDPLGTPLPSPERQSIPLPAGPRLSMAPGEETLEMKSDTLSISFASGHSICLAGDGKIVSWE